jgi:hypothetical protein
MENLRDGSTQCKTADRCDKGDSISERIDLIAAFSFDSWSVLFQVEKSAWQEQVGRCHREGSQKGNLVTVVGSVATSGEGS